MFYEYLARIQLPIEYTVDCILLRVAVAIATKFIRVDCALDQIRTQVKASLSSPTIPTGFQVQAHSFKKSQAHCVDNEGASQPPPPKLL